MNGCSAKPSPECTKLIMTELESLNYEFNANDPAELVGTNLHFYWESNSTLMASGIVIEGVEMINNEQLGAMEIRVIIILPKLVDKQMKFQ